MSSLNVPFTMKIVSSYIIIKLLELADMVKFDLVSKFAVVIGLSIIISLIPLPGNTGQIIEPRETNLQAINELSDLGLPALTGMETGNLEIIIGSDGIQILEENS